MSRYPINEGPCAVVAHISGWYVDITAGQVSSTLLTDSNGLKFQLTQKSPYG
jgi:hypothetical protein